MSRRSRVHLPTLRAVACVVVLCVGCHEDPPVERHYPMRSPPQSQAAPPQTSVATDPSAAESAPSNKSDKVPERPKPEPEIEALLERINASGLQFIDQADAPDSRATEHTAEQFASILRSKWDWIGYDITQYDTFVNEIATRSFKTNLPYLVRLQDGTTIELRSWIAQQPATEPSP